MQRLNGLAACCVCRLTGVAAGLTGAAAGVRCAQMERLHAATLGKYSAAACGETDSGKHPTEPVPSSQRPLHAHGVCTDPLWTESDATDVQGMLGVLAIDNQDASFHAIASYLSEQQVIGVVPKVPTALASRLPC